ncbi:hypothetical protein [Nitrobacter sp. 62-23]|uniref:hypothetical protein n=1 Tax=Nitrobacter sp. 62-23 TaxID=1895798 RepID=UPI00092BD9D0|nr:hypothetical protein [Nitrobacter sp. 62-23]MBN9147467.1 hypothetical protein [Nitrobacter sp.]OJV03249.1 MAG: hypothetical protein BGO16_00710 [Nitrobacter sp. 62-23]
MRQAGEVLRFWVSVLGLVIGLQSACLAAGSEGSGSPSPAAAEAERSAAPIIDAAPATESGDQPAAQASETATEKEQVPAERERDRDHSARSLQEMLVLFLKGAAALTVLVLFYKGLKRVFGPKQQSE